LHDHHLSHRWVRAGDVCRYLSGRQKGQIHQQLRQLIHLVDVRAIRKDRARHYEGKRLESSERNDGNGKVLKDRKGKEKELVDRQRACAGKVEGLYSGKEQETFKKEVKQSLNNGGLWKAPRKVMGRGVNWEDEWEEEEGLVVGELGRRMGAEEWSMEGEALVKESKVTGRQSMAVAWVPKNSIPPKLGQIQPFSSYLNSARCNLDENTKTVRVCSRYKCIAQKVKPVPLSDGSIPDAGLDWRGRGIARAVPLPGPWDE